MFFFRSRRARSATSLPDQVAAANVPEAPAPPAPPASPDEYWTRHNVTGHRRFTSREESLEYLAFRGAGYLFYDQLLPTSGHDDEVVLDYGCGPGNDLVGLLEHSTPRRIIGMDVASSSLEQARARVALHPGHDRVELHQVSDADPRIPLPDASVDYVHSSGVLHHTSNPVGLLEEFHRVLRPGGRAGIMVYNYDSIWLHLYVAWQLRLAIAAPPGETLADTFRRSTDGAACPISRCARPAEFLADATAAGFRGEFVGAAISLHEMQQLPQRLVALTDERLPREHRDFLLSLTFDAFGRPLYRGEVAGIDAVFALTRR